MREIVKDESGVTWAFDPQRASDVISRFARAKSMYIATKVEIDESWFHPDRAEITTDLRAAQKHKGIILDNEGAKFNASLSGSWNDAQRLLIMLHRETKEYNIGLLAKSKDANKVNEEALKTLERRMFWARTTRDVAIIGISVIAIVATGGVTLIVASAAGATLSGIATYQDTGDLKKAAGSAALFAIPGGAKYFGRVATVAGHSPKVVTAVTTVTDLAVDTTSGVFIDEQDVSTAVSKALITQGVTKGLGLAGPKLHICAFRRTKGVHL